MEEWVIPYSMHYKKLYRECTNALAEELKEKHAWKELFSLYVRASKLDPWEEWQIAMIDILIDSGEYGQAYQMYEKVVSRCQEEYGQLPAEMDKALQRLRLYFSGQPKSLKELCDQMLEGPGLMQEKTAQKNGGAYQCSYYSFRNVVQVFLNVNQRIGRSACLMRCTLVNRRKALLSGKPAESRSILLEQAVCASLREADVYTQYEPGQFLLLLNGTVPENGRKIFSRIIKRYQELGGSRRDVTFDVVELYRAEKK